MHGPLALVRKAWLEAKTRYLRRSRAAEFWTDAVGLVRPTARGQRLYRVWVERYDRLTASDVTEISAHIAALKRKPRVSIGLTISEEHPSHWRECIGSIRAQTYSDWELWVACHPRLAGQIVGELHDLAGHDGRIKFVNGSVDTQLHATYEAILHAASGEFFLIVGQSDELAPHALYVIVAEFNEQPAAEIIYSDEDRIDSRGRRHEPYFKSDWSALQILSMNMLGRLCAMRTATLRTIGQFRRGNAAAIDYDLALRIVARVPSEQIRHVPWVLYHRRSELDVRGGSNDIFPAAWRANREAIAEYLVLRNEKADILASAIPGFYRIRRHLPNPPPPVSLIVPTRDQFELLRNCVEGLMHKTRYYDLEVIVVDNGSRDPEALDYLAGISRDRRVRVLRIDGEFNFSALNNRAVAMANGAIVGFVNNDIEVMEASWLEEMVAHAVEPGIGAVGAKLYYPDDTIQHAGIVVGIWGAAAHDHRHFPRRSNGYFGQLQVPRHVTCVTGACLIMRRLVFLEVGGFNETDLKVAFNDVDLCLKVRAAGYDVVWTPYAQLYHLESASRGLDLTPAQAERAERELAYMKRRWGDKLRQDRFHNPNLTQEVEQPGLAFPPRVRPLWRRPRQIRNIA